MGSLDTTKKTIPHVVCIPYPAQGHINPMLKLAKLLHFKGGFHVTFVNTEFNHKRLLKARGPNSLNGLSSFRFETIPDGLPESDVDATQDIPSLCESTKLNIPEVLFWTTSACGIMCYMQYRHLVEKGLTPFKESSFMTNGYLETTINWVPGIKEIRLKDIPSFIRTTDPNDLMTNFLIGECQRAQKSSAIILNTFDNLEHNVLEAFSSINNLPPVYSIGPLNLLLKDVTHKELNSIGSNLWKEETECLEWLNKKEANTVVYVNFGSITVMTSEQMIEFAWGLANSKKTFLWIIRPDLVAGENAVLPQKFLDETKNRGLLSSWCAQEEVLNHSAIGGFLTHNGWNSTLESVCSGVPMICWPFFAEQQTNCRFCCNEWEIGLEIEDAKRDKIEDLVRELMDGEKGKEMKQKALEWKKLAQNASSGPHGSSFVNLENLICDVLL
ncbi:unnamed protein product [Trifolium pratense]|uniref:Uncharacterized protein n=1 Tax=Trifolium pratense TaxID=57577 RepID=A0ACB0JH83_TRIPR|nr:unnamed protein product [Trifolium pratense]